MNELVLHQAVDNVHGLLRRFLEDQTDDNRTDLLIVIRHYTLQGLYFTLTPEGVVVSTMRPPHRSYHFDA